MAKIKIKINIPYDFDEEEKPTVEKTEFSSAGKVKFDTAKVARSLKRYDLGKLMDKDIKYEIAQSIAKNIKKIKLSKGEVKIK